ncbi:hypothetical protein BDP27DRAFT_1362775 [Rhodocollybia butyracea]|uniref:Uncharacterized protein n=1 Tax=Rhodocollybia butyracea TaxID=206335 RepID=A0A9P5PY57_9AGAR|nr:hypothetical protein BDP27DRAFT_1362775 [Rhodocollybia butyracea]
MTIPTLEDRMRQILGNYYNHSVWLPHYDAVLEYHEDMVKAVQVVNDLEATEAAALNIASVILGSVPLDLHLPIKSNPLTVNAGYEEGALDLDWRWYHVPCLHGSEKDLLKALRSQERQDLVKDFHLSSVPGHIYLHVHSMLPNNTTLASYYHMALGRALSRIEVVLCRLGLGSEVTATAQKPRPGLVKNLSRALAPRKGRLRPGPRH